VRLSELVSGLPAAQQVGGDARVTGIAYDSRRVRPGDLFCAVRGARHDGHAFCVEACERGAVALLVERAVELPVPQVVVPSVRDAMGPVASRFWGQPSQALEVVGVTGTNGKGAVTFLVRAVLEAGGMPCGVVGTLGAWYKGRWEALERTTPEAPDLHALLARMVEAGLRAAAVEVASHALALGRVGGVRFRAAAFTNLTQDHLDFHGTFEAYRDAKARLFERVDPEGVAVVNADDPHGAYMAARSRAPVLTYGLREGVVRAEDVRVTAEGCTFTLATPAGRHPVRLRLVGRFNVANALCAAAVGLHYGVPLREIAEGLESVDVIPGRFERVEAGQPFSVIVDYAHTPDGLAHALETAREVARGRVIVAFGCGGDRDRSKRPRMGEVAATLADWVVVTSDNPRSEDPLAIVAEIVAGMDQARHEGRARASWEVEPDRRKAIRTALQMAGPGDVVLLCGKGHETVQILRDRTVPFDDREEAREALRELGWPWATPTPS
jgi:UDP-N-acetylmuramoyl-L-alanyl-D-glutamate--2,6-diaminopimelate ligase